MSHRWQAERAQLLRRGRVPAAGLDSQAEPVLIQQLAAATPGE
jgi:hypothetical protein